HLWQGTLEVESRVTDHLGLAVELGYSWASTSESGPELRAAASWSVLHNFEIGLHGQVELSVRFVGQVENGPNLGDSRLPFSAAFRLGLDRQWWTLRLGVGAATGGAPSAPCDSGLRERDRVSQLRSGALGFSRIGQSGGLDQTEPLHCRANAPSEWESDS